jgi:ribonuclease BN (tRNA processing enzyme)
MIVDMIDGISVRILGDFGTFSTMGKSIGYEVTIGDSTYLVDCGAPLFQQIGSPNMKNIKGIIVTHCHDDHKRWFTDLALFHRYEPEAGFKVFLLTSEDVQEELLKSSRTALDRSLSKDSKTIVDIPKDDYVTCRTIGPRARYRLSAKDDGNGMRRFYIGDSGGNIVGPDTAKIVISDKTSRPRILFRDPVYKEWVEPESFYPYSSHVFYEEDRNVFSDDEGFTIRALKSPVWHGVPNIGIRIKTDKETVVFSSDTVHDTELWEQLYQEKRIQNLKMSESDFEQASVIYGDINDYIERTWSEDRYNDAVNAFNDAVVIHDISCKNSVVHTDYEKLDKTVLNKEKIILTHGPDNFTSEWAMCFTDKIFRVMGDMFFEEVNGTLYPMDADIYQKDGEQFYVGYSNDKGKYVLSENEGLLRLNRDDRNVVGTPLYKVDLYEDLSGRYFPKIEDENVVYRERKDGRVELVEILENGSRGTIVEDHRDRLTDIASVDRSGKQIVS